MVQVLAYLVLQVQVEVEVVARRCVRTDCVCRHSSGEDQPTSVSGPGGDLRTPADGPRSRRSVAHQGSIHHAVLHDRVLIVDRLDGLY